MLGAYASIATKLPLRSSSASGSAYAAPLITSSAVAISLSCMVMVCGCVLSDCVDDRTDDAGVDLGASRTIEQPHLMVIGVAVVPVNRHHTMLVSGAGDVVVPVDAVLLSAVVLRSQNRPVLAHDYRNALAVDETCLHLLKLSVDPRFVRPGFGDRWVGGNRSPLPD